MHSLDNLHNVKGATTEGFRVGRGRGSGNGKTAGKGYGVAFGNTHIEHSLRQLFLHHGD